MESALKSRLRPAQLSAPNKVREVVLDGCKIKVLDEAGAEILANFTEVESLCLNQTGLASITSFPSLPKLKILELGDNLLTSLPATFASLLQTHAPNLEELSLAGNRLKNVEELFSLVALDKLRVLDVEMNNFADIPTYRQVLFQHLPQVEEIDGTDRSGKEAGVEPDKDESDEEGMQRNEETTLLKSFYAKDANELDDDDDDDAEIESDEDSEEDSDFDEESSSGEEEKGDVPQAEGGKRRMCPPSGLMDISPKKRKGDEDEYDVNMM